MFSRWRSSWRRLPSRATAPFGSGSPSTSLGPVALSSCTTGPPGRSPGGSAPPSPVTCGALDDSVRRQASNASKRSAVLFEAILPELLPQGRAVDAEHRRRPRLLPAARLEDAQHVAPL